MLHNAMLIHARRSHVWRTLLRSQQIPAHIKSQLLLGYRLRGRVPARCSILFPSFFLLDLLLPAAILPFSYYSLVSSSKQRSSLSLLLSFLAFRYLISSFLPFFLPSSFLPPFLSWVSCLSNFSMVFFNVSLVFFNCSMVFFHFSIVFFNVSPVFFNFPWFSASFLWFSSINQSINQSIYIRIYIYISIYVCM